MAKFTADVTKNASPAMADPSSAMRAAGASSAMLSTLVEGAKQGLNAYNQKVVTDARVGTEEAQSIFYNEAFEQPRQNRDNLAAATAENDARAMGSGIDSPDSMAKVAAVKAEMARLQLGVEQGRMGLAAYQTRVQNLARTTTAAAPWMGMEIRKTIMETSGLPYIDRETTAAYYTQEMIKSALNPKGASGKEYNPEEDEIKQVVQYNPVGFEDALKIKRNDPEKWRALVANTADKRAVEQREKQITAAKIVTEGQMWTNAAKGTDVLVAEAGVKVTKSLVDVMGRNQPLLTELAKAGATTNLASVPQLQAKLGVVQSEITAAIQASTRDARQELINKRSLMNEADFKANMDRITAQEKLWLESATPQQIGTTLQALSSYRDKTLEERLKMVQAHSSFIAAYGETDLMKAVISGDKDMIAQIERVRPGLVARVRDAFSASTESLGTASAMIAVAGAAMQDAKDNPNPSPVPAGSDPNKARDGAAIVDAEGVVRLLRMQSNGTFNKVSQEDANVFATMISNAANGISTGVVLKEQNGALRESFRSMAPDVQAVTKAAIAQHQTENLTTIIKDLEPTKLKVGNMPDGRVVVMPPMEMLEPRKTGAIGPDDTVPRFAPTYFASKYKPYEGLVVKKGMEKAYQEYERQAKEFENKIGPRVFNMVYGRSIATDTAPQDAGKELALAINTRKVPAPFAVYAPVVPEAPAKTASGSSFYAGTQKTSMKSTPEEMDKVLVLTQEVADIEKRVASAPNPEQRAREEADLVVAKRELEKAKGSK